MNVSRGDLVIVDLEPTKGHEIEKKRPGVVIQNDIGNRNSPLTIIAPTSGGDEEEYPVEVSVGTAGGDLDKNSVVKLDQIRCVSVEIRIDKKIGKLSPERMRRVDKAIKISLGLQ